MSRPPLFTALATSTRQIHHLLRCVAFTPQAHVHITPDGLKFTTEDVHAIQASTLLDKSLFSSYLVDHSEDAETIAPFQVNIIALLETLHIFTMSDAAGTAHRHQGGGMTSSYAAAFQTPALGLNSTCKITYTQPGAPLSIIIEQAGVKTTCEMNTYSLANMYDADGEIPLDRNALVLKIIMPSLWLHDAISELASTNTDTLTATASSLSAPYFALEGHGGPFGDSSVNFDPDPKVEPGGVSRRKQPAVTETFTVAAPSGQHGRVKQRYRFDMIKRAGRAMQAAGKVSVRMDVQGVLSLQFMIDRPDSQGHGGTAFGTLGHVTGPGDGAFSFVDYRFVPLADSDTDDGDGDGDGNGNGNGNGEEDSDGDGDDQYHEVDGYANGDARSDASDL